MVSTARSIWRLAGSVKVNGRIPLKKYISERTGMSVAVADVEGPMVNGSICFATETCSDEGLPHTLEHLVFMGSEQYPFKGVLDILANRCLASGTNAWTAQDHTNFTLSTVGSEGFLKLLPVYLDHLLYPNLTDGQYTTEVHHINGEGDDAGVVYCEMQDTESDIDSLVEWKRKELLYPADCCYRVETGGRLAHIRTSCSNEKVRRFHSSFYDPRNMLVLVCGLIDHSALLTLLDEFNPPAMTAPFARPFQSVVPRIRQSTTADVVCPCDDEHSGRVELAWHGPNAKDIDTCLALVTLFKYLDETAVAPLERDFVQLSDPYCSSVDLNLVEQSLSEIVLQFEDVPVDKLDLIRNRFFDVTLSSLLDCNLKGFDLERMHHVIDQSIRTCLSQLEAYPNSAIVELAISNFLFDDSDQDLMKRMNSVAMYEQLKSESGQFWLDLLAKYMGRNVPCVCVVGKPSAEQVEKVTEEEEDRIERQVEKLGAEGLERCATTLKKAVFENESKKPSSELLDRFIVHNLNDLNRFPINEISNLTSKSPEKDAISWDELPFSVTVHDCKTDFVDATMVFDTSSLAPALRPWLMLWSELMFESPARIDGSLCSYEQVVRQYSADLESCSADLGVHRLFDRYLSVRIKVDAKSYVLAAKWMQIFLNGVEFDSKRLAIVAKKLVNSTSSSKRDGNYVAETLLNWKISLPDSNSSVYNDIRLENFHREVAELADKSPNSVLDKLATLRNALVRADQAVLHLSFSVDSIIGHVPDVRTISDVWKSMFDNENVPQVKRMKRQRFNGERQALDLDEDGFGHGLLTPIGACESGFLNQSCPFIRDFHHPDLAPSLLLIQYVTQSEGPLWRVVRGRGLAYGANISYSVDKGLLHLSLYCSAQLVQAYEQTVDIIKSIVIGDVALNEAEFEAAKRSLVFELVSRKASIKKACEQATLAYYRRVPFDHSEWLCRRIWDVKIDELLPKGGKYLLSLINCHESSTGIAVHPSKVDETVAGFEQMGRNLQPISIDDPNLLIKRCD